MSRRHDPAPLPEVDVHDRGDGSADVVVNGHRAGWPVPLAELGTVLATIADRAGGPVRVAVHQPDGTTHHDTITPPQPPIADPRPAGLARGWLVVGGFRPGEPVDAAKVIATGTAGPDGTVRVRVGRRTPRRPVLLVGRVSGFLVRPEPR